MQLIIPDSYSKLFKANNKIIKYPSNILRAISEPVPEDDNVSSLLFKMSGILHQSGGVGLAAPQIGVNKQIVMIQQAYRFTFINPVIEESSAPYILEDEGCLSIPGLWGKVARSKHIVVSATLPNGEREIFKLSDMMARIAQHEIDHLNGVLFMDKVIPESLHWFDARVGKRLDVKFEETD